MESETEYQEALNYIYSFVDFSLTRNLRYAPEKFNLNRMIAFLNLLENPQNHYCNIHVAGTKGKGSICAMISSILTCAGYSTGFYSSPHMVDFAERIRIGNQLISHQEITKLINGLKPSIEKIDQITTFEITTAMAFKYFKDKDVDISVIEVGMGGRFDATNVIKPCLSVISTISHDHTKILGNTLEKIAFEKSGIIKNSIPVVMSKQKISARKMIAKIAQEKNAKLIDASKEYKLKTYNKQLEFQEFEILKEKKSSGIIKLPLIGDHQQENAVSAFAAIHDLRTQGWNISDDAIREGFYQVHWPGRFELIHNEPLLIIDGAHNPDSFRRLVKTIIDYFPGKSVTFIFGASEDKNVSLMLKIMKPVIDTLIATKSTHPRAMDPVDIMKIAGNLNIKCFGEDSIETAITKAKNTAGKNGVIIAGGSIFVAGAVREILVK